MHGIAVPTGDVCVLFPSIQATVCGMQCAGRPGGHGSLMEKVREWSACERACPASLYHHGISGPGTVLAAPHEEDLTHAL